MFPESMISHVADVNWVTGSADLTPLDTQLWVVNQRCVNNKITKSRLNMSSWSLLMGKSLMV